MPSKSSDWMSWDVINCATQGSPNANPAPAHVLLPIRFTPTVRNVNVQDFIQDDNVNFGEVWNQVAITNYLIPVYTIPLWPNAKELHESLLHFVQDIPTGGPPVAHSYPVVPYDSGLATTFQVISKIADDQDLAYGTITSWEYKMGRKGQHELNLEVPVIGRTTNAAAQPSRAGASTSLWRQLTTLSAFGGNDDVLELSIKFEVGAYFVPPDFGSSDLEVAAIYRNGKYKGTVSGRVFADNYDAFSNAVAATVEDFSAGVTFNDGTNSFTLTLGDALIQDVSEGEEEGRTTFDFTAVLTEQSGGSFLSLGALS